MTQVRITKLTLIGGSFAFPPGEAACRAARTFRCLERLVRYNLQVSELQARTAREWLPA
jgi:hypothetical protein